SVSTRMLARVIVLLIAGWSLVAGLILVGFHGASADALGAGIADRAGQRLVGALLLTLTPAFVMVALRSHLYHSLVWLPFVTQAAIALTVGYSIITGDTSFGDGALAMTISAMLAGALSFVWITEARTTAHAKFEAMQARAHNDNHRPDDNEDR